MIKKIIDKRLLPLLLALSLLFGVSLVALAAGGDGSGGGTGNAGVQPTMAGTGFQLRLSNPDISMSNDGGTYVLDGEYDPTQDIVFTFSLNPNGGQRGFGIYPAKDDSPAGFDGVIVYDKSDSDKTPVLSLGGNYSAETMNPDFFFEEIEDSSYPDHLVFKMADSGFSNERTADLTIKANSLEGGKTYCLYLPSSIKTYNNGGSKQLGADITIEFATKKTAPEVLKTWSVGECTATLYDNGNFVVEANEGGSGIANGMEPPPWFLDGTDRKQIKQAEIKDGVTSVGLFFFLGCENLSQVSLPETLETVGPLAFAESGIESITLPAKVKSIADSTFNSCKRLTEVKFQEGLETIGEGAFLFCDSLTSLTLPSTVKTIAANAFSVPEMKDIYIQSNGASITIDKWVCSNAQCATTFHVKCDQLTTFKEKNTEITNVTFAGDIHTPGDAVKENEVPATCTAEGSYDEVVYCSVCNEEVSRETKTIEALGHTEEVLEAVEATCTEPGKTKGTKCSVCGEILKAQEAIPALGHDYEVIPEVISTCTSRGSTAGARCKRCGEYLIEPKEVPMVRHEEETIPGKPATCTEDGKTEGKKCSVCGTILEEPKTIAKLGHKYVDGVCERCNEKDPDYKPTPVEPVSKFTGLANEADKDGVWWYYTDGEIDKTHTGVDQNKYGWWRVENGKVNFKAQGIYQNSYGWWKTTDGKVTFKENSIYKNEYGWWKCKDSKVDFNAQSIYQNQYGWWKTTDGKVTFKENGLFKNQYGTWKVENSKVNFNYNGTYQGKTIKNGKVQ